MQHLAWHSFITYMSMREKRIHILIGEDNYAELKLFEIAAQESGLSGLAKIDNARDGEEVVLKLIEAAEKGRQYDLLVLDLNMPRMSGVAVLEHINKKQLADRPIIIILTNSDSPRDREECLANGADAFMQKPADFYQIEDFCRTLKNCLELNKSLSIDFIRMNYNGVH